MIELKLKSDCCGCSACVQKCPKQCIFLKEDFEGFLYPEIDKEICIDCGLCEKVCPVINQNEPRKPLKVYAAKNKNEQIRLNSSSGGVFTLLAEHTIAQGGVVFGAKFNKDWEVIHDYTETMDGIAAFRGSKYVQSRIGETYKLAEQFLKDGRKVLFIGTPCQIAGLKLFLRKEYDNLLTVDFVCHGVPSPKVFRMYLDEIIAREGVAGKNTVSFHPINKRNLIRDIKFRDKKLGWKKFSFVLTLSATQGAEKNSVLFTETLDKNVFMKGFLKDLYLRPSCYQCPSKSLKSGSDLTIADYWGIENAIPDFDDDKGVSLVMINSDDGDCFYKNVRVEQLQTLYKDALVSNQSIEKSCKIPEERSSFFLLFEKRNLLWLINMLTKTPFLVRVKLQIKRVIRFILVKMGLLCIVKDKIKK